jgi:pimeloyl-ACP methyl ester carboxylesterase
VLLHGFPDNAWTWEPQFGRLTHAGFDVLAIPSGVPAQRTADLIERRAEGPVAFVGHDWGASIAYLLAGRWPDLIARAVMVAVPHPAAAGAIIDHPGLLHESFHHWLFQLPGLSEAALAANGHALVDYLWELWTSGPVDAAHVSRVKSETLSRPGALEAALGYYRAMYRGLTDGTLELAPISVPSLVVFGSGDPHAALVEGQERWFTAEHRVELIHGARHFVHRERAEEFNRLLLDWLDA